MCIRDRDEVDQALAKSEDARAKRDALCLYIAQHRMTGTERDIAQYISLSLYLTPPPEMETTADLTEMPPDATQVVEVVPALKAFAAAVDLHGIWLTVHTVSYTHLKQRSGDELKLVYPQAGAEPAQFESLDFRHFFLQPMDGPDRAPNTQLALQFCLEHPHWRLSLQTHKLLGIP